MRRVSPPNWPRILASRLPTDHVETAYRETIRAPCGVSPSPPQTIRRRGTVCRRGDLGRANAARRQGFQFEEVVKGGAVPKNYIPSVEHGAKDALAQGPEGFPVVDVKVTLSDGKHHNVDSSDYAFRMAGKNAVREALPQAKPVVLQPILNAEIHLPSDFRRRSGPDDQLAAGAGSGV